MTIAELILDDHAFAMVVKADRRIYSYKGLFVVADTVADTEDGFKILYEGDDEEIAVRVLTEGVRMR